MSSPQPNPHDIHAIRNTLARYSVALDTKVFNLLDKVFVHDAQADYPFNPRCRSAEDIKNGIRESIGPIPTHHSLTTQMILMHASSDASAPATANATTNFIGTYFGVGPHEGEVLTFYGHYLDELVCLDGAASGGGGAGDRDGVPGASGVWRIRKRTLVLTGSVGDERIMSEY